MEEDSFRRALRGVAIPDLVSPQAVPPLLLSSMCVGSKAIPEVRPRALRMRDNQRPSTFTM
jgi:hypothetical protein